MTQRISSILPVPDHFSVEDDLTKELMKLSFKDRMAIQEEMHGVRCLAAKETPELIENKLLEFDERLMEVKRNYRPPSIEYNYPNRVDIPSSDGDCSVLRNVESISNQPDAMDIIATSDPSKPTSKKVCYVNDPNVRLRFLRCECFDVPKAVNRFVQFLELSCELFGDCVAHRPMQITDFRTRKEEVALHNSRNQYLPFRDRSGRRVYVGVGRCDFDIEPYLRYKIILFCHWIASEEVETQQKGIVIVAFPTNEGDDDDDQSWEKSIRHKLTTTHRRFQKLVNNGQPIRVCSQHSYFKDTPFWRTLAAMYYIGMDHRSRTIYKVHFGEPMELRYILAGYGIPQHLIPLSNTGTVKTSNHSRWINALRSKADREQHKLNNEYYSQNGVAVKKNANEEDFVDCPGSKDVIFRKGPTYKNNPGNMYFRELIEETSARHAKAPRKEKCRITWNIVKEIEARNGRFLDWSKTREMWVVAKDREKIRKKVAACYKQYNRTVLIAQQQQQRKNATTTVTDSEPETHNEQQDSKQQSSRIQDSLEEFGSSDSVSKTAAIATTILDPKENESNIRKIDRKLREYYSLPPGLLTSTKRRKTYSLFCGGGYCSGSDSSNSGCGFLAS